MEITTLVEVILRLTSSLGVAYGLAAFAIVVAAYVAVKLADTRKALSETTDALMENLARRLDLAVENAYLVSVMKTNTSVVEAATAILVQKTEDATPAAATSEEAN